MREAFDWAKYPDAHEVRVKQLQDLVRRADETRYVAEYKRAQLKVAYYWYRAALGFFGLLGFALFWYVLDR